MTDPEDPAAKNEQELNLFSDQPRPDETQAEPVFPGAVTEEIPDENIHGRNDVPSEPEQGIPAQERPENESPVVAPPPPPRKQPSSVRPGIVAPRAGRAVVPPPASPAATSNRKPLPHAIHPEQSLGQMLAAIRAERGLSLEEVAYATRIRTEYLVELESGVLQKELPHVYVSAYVRKLIETYDLSKEDCDILLDKMNGETPQDPEELPEKFIKSVNEGAMVNENESKRIRNFTIIVYSVIGIVAVALLWLIILVIVNYSKPSEPAPGGRDPAADPSGAVQPAEEPVSRTVHLDESELDALIVPETPSISVLKMSKVPGVRESL